ncbi:MAG: hypothetical protein WBB76_05860 [Gaiellaceae bacterium]
MARRAAALAVLALLVAGCGTTAKSHDTRLGSTGPPGVVRIALSSLLWPLDPARAEGRDQIVLARALFATPLRTDPSTGALRPGLCSTWRSSDSDRSWRLRCRHAGAIATELRRAHLIRARRITAPDEHTLAIRLLVPSPELPYLLTEVAAAPPGVPGPFRLISAAPTRVVAERPGLRLVFRRLEPHAALRLFREGLLDEAPVPLGDLQAELRSNELGPTVRVQDLLAVDAVVSKPNGALARYPTLGAVYDATADRADYQALVPEFKAPPAENLVERPAPSARVAALAARNARKQIGSLPRVAVRFAEPTDPDLAYGANLLVAAWRDMGLGPFFGTGRPDARFARVLAPYPRADALRRVTRRLALIPIAWVVDARLVSPRLRGWREDELGAVDYTRVRTTRPGPSRSP